MTDATLPADARSAPPARLNALARQLLRFWAPALLVVVAIGFTAVYVHGHRTFAMSPIDEFLYVDYMYKIPHEWYVHQGEILGVHARMLDSCFGVRGYGKALIPCGGDYSQLQGYPQHAITSVSGFTPLYFEVTWVLGEVIHRLTGVNDISAWRFTGAFWLALALVLFWVVARRLRIPDIATVGLGLLLIASPFSVSSFTFINTDGPGLVFGLLLVILAWDFLAGRRSGWWLVLAGAVATAFKATNLIGVGTVAAFILVAWWFRRHRARSPGWPERDLSGGSSSSWSLPLFAVLPLIAGIVVEYGWLSFVARTAVGPLPVQGLATEKLGLLQLPLPLRSALDAIGGTIVANHEYVTSASGALIQSRYVDPFSWVTVLGVLGALFTMRKADARFPLIIATATGAFLGLPVLGYVMTIALHGTYYATPARYASSILPLFLLMTGLFARQRALQWALLGGGAAMVAFMVASVGSYA